MDTVVVTTSMLPGVGMLDSGVKMTEPVIVLRPTASPVALVALAVPLMSLGVAVRSNP